MHGLIRDLRHGLRLLLKNPGFSFVAVVTMGLGIGANTAIFSVADAVLFHALPFEDPDRLVLIWQSKPQGGWPENPVSYPNFADWRKESRSFEEMAAWSSYADTKFNLTGGEEPEQVQYALVSDGFFRILGVRPAMGRDLLPEEDRPGGPRAAVITHALWQRRFGSDPALLGKSLTLDGNAYTVVGILPPGFRFINYPQNAEIYVPLACDPLSYRRRIRPLNFLGVLGRLKKDVSVEQAQAEMTTIARRLEVQYPEADSGWGAKVTPLKEEVAGRLRPAVLALLGAVAFVLLIGCANVANLLLARSTERRKEFAIRMAVGAGRGRLLLQVLAESLLLGAGGGVAGILLGAWGIELLGSLPYYTPGPFIPYGIAREQIALNGPILILSLALSVAATLISAIAPALQASKPDMNDALRADGARPRPERRGFGLRGLLVVAEIALSLVLLIGSGLLLKTFLRLQRVDPGFNPESLLTMEISLPRSKYGNDPQIAAFYRSILGRIGSLPGVISAGAVSFLPMSGGDEGEDFFIEGRPLPAPGEDNITHPRSADPGYFPTLGIHVVRGRGLSEKDTAEGARVAVVNEAMARRFWPGEDPVGRHLALHGECFRFIAPNKPPELDLSIGWREIVGVVRDVQHVELGGEPEPELYLADLQRPSRAMTVVVRAAARPLDLVPAVRSEVFGVDHDQPISNVRTMEHLVSDSIAKPRFNSLLLVLFATVALALAAVGVYGVIAFTVSRRTREIGIRIALGARKADVLKLVVGEGAALTLAGVLLGMGSAAALTRFLSSLLFNVSPLDASTFLAVPLILSGVALLACWLPARRAAGIDPVVALRSE